LRASAKACPVPTATTRTWIPVAVVNIGMRWENRPEFSVEVVEARTMNLSLAWSGLASSAPRRRKVAIRRRVIGRLRSGA
jgi:hypothetical protein